MILRKLFVAQAFFLLFAGLAHADLDVAIRDLNISAEGNIGDFKARLGARFGVGTSRVDLVLRSVDHPADAAIVLWMGECTGHSVDRVLNVYRSHRGQGWGTVARHLGIKPGSAAFHALKRGDLNMSGGGKQERGRGHGKTKEKNGKKWG